MSSKEWKIVGLYFTDDERLKKEFRDIMLQKYLDEADNDMEEALALMAFRYEIAIQDEYYEECAIIKDILDYFEYFPDR